MIDCPYKALVMVPDGDREIAEVDPDLCVACGICVGSCVFDAIELTGATLPPEPDVEGKRIVVACDRHRRLGLEGDEEVLTVRCVGVLSPTAISGLMKQGAESAQVVGCPAGDCAYGVGNQLAEERIQGERRPRLPGRTARATTRDFVAPTAIKHALATPGTHLSADPKEVPKTKIRLAVTAAIVLGSMLAVGLATTIVFTVNRPEAGVLVVVDHQPGAVIQGADSTSGSPGTRTILRTQVGDSPPVETQIGTGGKATAVEALDAAAGEVYLLVELIEGADRTVIRDGVATLEPGRRLVIEIVDEAATDAAAGEKLFFSQKAGCTVCHSVEPGVELVGAQPLGGGECCRRAGSGSVRRRVSASVDRGP